MVRKKEELFFFFLFIYWRRSQQTRAHVYNFPFSFVIELSAHYFSFYNTYWIINVFIGFWIIKGRVYTLKYNGEPTLLVHCLY